jgi:2,4-dienoyl-CoA reductase-like NADH-dependent reductase (Old Yellow Enzyme family)
MSMTSLPPGLDSLFQPFRLRGLALRNRFVMAPMTRQQSPGGVPNEANQGYYGRRAEAEVGLLLTEGTFIERPGYLHTPGVPRFHGAEALAGWGGVVAEVHARGGAIAPQLWHVGTQPNGAGSPVETEGPASMTLADIEDTIAAYGRAAAEAKRLGFDALEIHGAHGYLLDQFFYAKTNQRTDAYGGATLAERTRFGVAVMKAVRQAVGPEMVVILRLSQWKGDDYTARNATTPQELEAWLGPLSDAGTDIFHMSQRRFWEPEFEGSDLNTAGWAKKLTGKPTITVGSVGISNDFLTTFGSDELSRPEANMGELVRRFERGDFDLVAVGRALLEDPQWLRKVKEGRHDELQSFTRESLGRYY